MVETLLSTAFECCTLCPRACRVNRTAGERGFCGAGDQLRVARAALHFWEEPCISGKNGSGTVFFSHCSLGCVYCQNDRLSHEGFGRDITPDRLREIYMRLIGEGAHNINLVTPSHFLPLILPTLEGLPVPVVMNCGGYESVETLRALEGRVQIYLPDMKYALAETAAAYSHAPDYPEKALAAIREMIRQVGKPVFDRDGMLQSGVIVRHMILPNETKNSFAVIALLKNELEPGSFLFSLMSQYTPCGRAKDIQRIARRLTPTEYARVLKKLDEAGITEGYVQELSSAKEEYIPPFDLTGI